jgi:hypothetical protein
MIERVIKRFLLCVVCMFCLTFYCSWEDDDHHHHDHDNDNQSSLMQDELHRENKAENLLCVAKSVGYAIADVCESDVRGIVSSTDFAMGKSLNR